MCYRPTAWVTRVLASLKDFGLDEFVTLLRVLDWFWFLRNRPHHNQEILVRSLPYAHFFGQIVSLASSLSYQIASECRSYSSNEWAKVAISSRYTIAIVNCAVLQYVSWTYWEVMLQIPNAVWKNFRGPILGTESGSNIIWRNNWCRK